MSYSSINRVVLVGRLTRDPELRALPSGLSVCGLRLACNANRKTIEGDYQDKPNYFDVSVFGAAGENVARYTRRGGRVAIDGRLEWREWETAEQQRRQAVSVVADNVQFLDGPSDRSDVGSDQEGEPGGDGEGAEHGEERELVGVGAGPDQDDLVF
jgi:single-strand DNA-binding protein